MKSSNGHLSANEREIVALSAKLNMTQRLLGAAVEAAGGDYCFSAESIEKARRVQLQFDQKTGNITVIVTDVPEPEPAKIVV